jgi:phosphatidylserine decarboxylase
MKKIIYQRTIELTNGPVTSALFKYFSRSKSSRWIIPNYIKTYKIETGDLVEQVSTFPTLHDFFIRKLTPVSRPLAGTPVTMPVDGKIEIFGDLYDGLNFQVKNQQYSLADLLGNSDLADHFSNGKYAVLYLSPADYHRIHSPADGTVINQYVKGKKSYPVNSSGLMYGKSPISGNYRMVTELETAFGRMLLVKVGAMFVNSIELTNLSEQWHKGEEVGYFSFGSTVVLFFEKNQIEFCEGLTNGQPVKMGEALANML